MGVRMPECAHKAQATVHACVCATMVAQECAHEITGTAHHEYADESVYGFAHVRVCAWVCTGMHGRAHGGANGCAHK